MSGKVHMGRRIKFLLEKRNIPVITFAEMIETSEQNAHRIFHRENIHTKLLTKIADSLGYSIIEILQDEAPLLKEPESKFHKKEKNYKEMYFQLLEENRELRLHLEKLKREKK